MLSQGISLVLTFFLKQVINSLLLLMLVNILFLSVQCMGLKCVVIFIRDGAILVIKLHLVVGVVDRQHGCCGLHLVWT